MLTPFEMAWSGVALDPGSSVYCAFTNCDVAFAKLFARAELFFLHLDLGIIQYL